MPSVEVYAPSDTLAKVRALLAARDGVDHVVVGGTSVDGSRVLVTAGLIPRVVDALLPELVACGVPGDEIAVIHRDGQRPMGSPAGEPPAWEEGRWPGRSWRWRPGSTRAPFRCTWPSWPALG